MKIGTIVSIDSLNVIITYIEFLELNYTNLYQLIAFQ